MTILGTDFAVILLCSSTSDGAGDRLAVGVKRLERDHGLTILLRHLEERDYSLVAVELAASSVSLFEASYPPRPCFLLGAELGGVPEAVLARAELVVEIPQWGLVPSLNLAVAFTFSEATWVSFKLFGLMGLTFLFALGQGYYMVKHSDESLE